ncbi:MAG: hypothetical protein GYB64_18375 [Chloroflexi bacterium]|nr:hypothetical protein [Chloroflexota bacterium]
MRILLTAIVALGLAACVPLSEPDLEQSTTADLSTLGGPCDHRYWPLRDGATWTYTISGRPDLTGEVTLSTRSVDAQTAQLLTGEYAAEVTCTGGAIVGLPPGLFGAGHPDLAADLQATSVNGQFLAAPESLIAAEAGTTWDHELDPTGAIGLPINGQPESTPVRGGKMVVFDRLLGREQVATPAGTFDALAIQSEVFYQMQVPGTEVVISTTVVWYFAEVVGPVRLDFQGGTVSSPEGAWPLDGGIQLLLNAVTLP